MYAALRKEAAAKTFAAQQKTLERIRLDMASDAGEKVLYTCTPNTQIKPTDILFRC